VRALYTDVTFIDEFLTPEFVTEHKLFTFGWSNRNDRFEIDTREFKAVKEKLLFQLTNFGNPFIAVEDGNHENRGELLLRHEHHGRRPRPGEGPRDPALASTACGAPRGHRHHQPSGRETVLLRYDGKDHVTRPIR
jgi:stage V sporulation protein R